MGPKDPLAWAKRPASDHAARAVLALAKTDRRFAQIARFLIEEGVINRAGRLLLTIEGERVDLHKALECRPSTDYPITGIASFRKEPSTHAQQNE
ncbi:MAG: hypothetical protein JNK99_15705 [Candidatus Accumulibacter sp.]|uniref:hypothetical protein n=1 Tax=Accumulibacter sp. TaxID=2053492 RepID=UPI001A3CDC69|nr:hypothetical protein [Accumulibacter sp.]MBL8396165.1 hypothetical protein [Accumulibacter sp.]